MKGMRSILLGIAQVLAVGALPTLSAQAEVSFLSASNGVSLHEILVEGSEKIFVLKGLSDNESSDLSFSTSSGCSLIGMVGGAKFSSNLECAEGVISTSVVYKGGLSFGPGTEANKDTFYVTFSDPPAAPGSSTPADVFGGIQMAVYGDISSWNMTGKMSGSGASFGVELAGPQGGEAHFQLGLPKAAVDFLGGVLGVEVGGKPDPFASVVTNEDGSVSLKVSIANLQPSASRASGVLLKARTIKRKILASKRKLSIASSSPKVKSGGTLHLAMCAGSVFKEGDSARVSFASSGKQNRLPKSISMVLDKKGCSKKSIALSKKTLGSIVAKVTYKGKNAMTTIKVIK